MSTSLGGKVRFTRALRSPSFALLWAGQTISVLGDGAFTVALAWSILLFTGSAADLPGCRRMQRRTDFLLHGERPGYSRPRLTSASHPHDRPT
jgi:hypothetical protein